MIRLSRRCGASPSPCRQPPLHTGRAGGLVAMLAVWAMACAGASHAQSFHRVDEASGIETWEVVSQGVSLSLTQILPQQARAFYVNRGFTLDEIARYADSCVYMAVMRNDRAPGIVHFRLADWSVQSEGDEHPPLDANHWLAQPELRNAAAPARLALKWAQLPAEQEYRPGGDWNQGMLSMGLAAGARFDLIFRWDVAGEAVSAVMQGVRCAD